MTDICFEKAIQTLYDIQTAESLRLEEQTQSTEISFSEKLEKQMKKLIHRREKPYYVLINTVAKRVAVIILAVIITTVSATIGIAAIYQPFADFIMEIFDDHTLFRPNRNNQTSSTDPLTEWKAYTPSYIPEGFKVAEYNFGVRNSYVNYANENGDYFRIIQGMANGAHTTVDTENTDGEYINIGKIQLFYYVNKGENHLFFKYGINSIFLHGNIDKNELINIAISLKFEEK